MIKLTTQQRDAVKAHPGEPVPLVDDANEERFVLLSEADFLRLRELADGTIQSRHDQLKFLIGEGIASPPVQAEEAFAHMRESARQAAQRHR